MAFERGLGETTELSVSVIRSSDHSGPGRELRYGATKSLSGCSPLSLSSIGMARAGTVHLLWGVFGLGVLLNFQDVVINESSNRSFVPDTKLKLNVSPSVTYDSLNRNTVTVYVTKNPQLQVSNGAGPVVVG